jgi:hypothetical protein
MDGTKEPCSATVNLSPDRLSYPFGEDQTTGTTAAETWGRRQPVELAYPAQARG